MDGTATTRIEAVRSFNRTVTERVGVLHDRYLGCDRPIGEARLLWEIGLAQAGLDVRELRARLALDSGYLSRLLRSLEQQKLIALRTGETDRRLRRATLTARGRRERTLLDRRSNELASGMLERLSESQCQRLVAAMAEVERLLAGAMVELAAEDPRSADARECVARYFEELARRFEGGFDESRALPFPVAELLPPMGLLVIARLRGRAVGCAALKFYPRATAEIKRMWIACEVRGTGLGSRLLAELERLARESGARTLRLETNRALTEAIALYRRRGFREVAPFNAEPYAHHWFEKRLKPSA